MKYSKRIKLNSKQKNINKSFPFIQIQKMRASLYPLMKNNNPICFTNMSQKRKD